ncbi:MAG TPA: DUF882 domain-containing protein [Kofleriaceae bacterium]|nr:DUF882 domain-containing protein [Kofleriaceae bacterium]
MIRAAGIALGLGISLTLGLASPTAARAEAPAAKKDLAARAKSPRHPAAPAAGGKPGKLCNLYNQWTHEWLAVDPAAPPTAATVDHFLRDHFTNKPTRMEPRLIGFVTAAAGHFHVDAATIVSGFRHPKYNLILRKKGHQVARDSQHTHGTAIDFFLPGVAAPQLAAWARAQKLGGVGFYPESGFVHMDTGPVRTWSGE